MPMIGCGDEASVDIFSREELAEVAVFGATLILISLVYSGTCLLELVRFYIANGDHLRVLLIQKTTHIPLSLRTEADATDGNPVAGRNRSGSTQG